MRREKGRIFYGWYIVAAGFLVMFCSIGIINNCAGLYIKPVCEDMGFSRGSMAVNMTIISACQMLVALFGGKIFVRFDVRSVMRISSITLAVSYFCYSFVQSLPVYYALSVIVGLSMGGIAAMPLSLLVGNWFEQRRGFAIGVAFMGSGIGGMLFSALAGQLITGVGWRQTYRVLGAIAFVILVPVCWLVVRTKPADMGLRPYGQKEEEESTVLEEKGISMQQAVRSGRFWTLCLVTALTNISMCALSQNVTPHLSDEGYSLTAAANISAVMLGALAGGKMLLGWLYDKLGARGATLFANCCTVVAVLGVLFCKVPVMLLAIIVGFALGNAFGSVANPLIVQSMYGRKSYSAILGVVTASNNLAGALTPVMVGMVYDHFGSYRPAFLMMELLSIFCAVSYFLLLSKKVEYDS